MVISCFVYNHLEKYHSSPSEVHSPYRTTQCLRELKNVNTIALKFQNIINLSVFIFPVCEAVPHFDIVCSDFFSDKQFTEKYFCSFFFFFFERSYLMKHLSPLQSNKKLSINKAEEMEITGAIS